MPLLSRKRTILAKAESSYGVDPTPTGSANAILVRNLTFTPQENELASRDVIRTYLGNSEQIPAAIHGRLEFEIEMAGAGTAGTAPAYGPVLEACGFSKTLLAAAQAGTAQAGAASTITLAAGASATDDIYNNHCIRTTGGTGSGQQRIISDYVGSTKVATVTRAWTVTPDNTTTYSIDAQAVYAPISDSIPSVTIYFNEDGVFHKLLGCRGNVSVDMTNKQIPVYRFTFWGIYVAVADGAAPTPVYTAFQTPKTVTNANTTPFSLHSFSAVMSALSLDMANAIVHRSLVGGSESVLLTDRKPAGQITIEATTVADKDWWTIAKDVTLGELDITHGTATGNKVQLFSKSLQINSPNYTDLDGVAMLQMNIVPVPVAGNDELLVIVK